MGLACGSSWTDLVEAVGSHGRQVRRLAVQIPTRGGVEVYLSDIEWG